MAMTTNRRISSNLSTAQKKIAVGILIFVGLIFASIGALIGFEGFRTSGWTNAQGTVTKVETSTERVRRGNDRPRRTATFYKPTFRYEANNQQYTVASSNGSETVLSTGDEIDIKYNPSDPSEAVYQPAQTSFLSVAFIAIGLFVAGFGIIVLVSVMRGKS